MPRSEASRQRRRERKAQINAEIEQRAKAFVALELRARQIKDPTEPGEDSGYLLSKGWVSFRGKWIDGLAFSEDAFFSPDMPFGDALRIQQKRDSEEALNSLEGRRSMFLGVLSARKKGPVPLEQARAAFLFSLERRAIALIESS